MEECFPLSSSLERECLTLYTLNSFNEDSDFSISNIPCSLDNLKNDTYLNYLICQSPTGIPDIPESLEEITLTPSTSTACFDYDPLFQCWDSGLLTRRCNGALTHGEDSSVISSLCMFSDASAWTLNSPRSDQDSYSESVARFGKCEDELVVLGVGLNTLMSGCPEEKIKTDQELLSGSKTRNMSPPLHSQNILVKRTNAVKFSPPPSSTGFSRDFQCHYAGCNKIYSKRSHLQAHLRRHSGEKPFVCQWPSCIWRFSRSDELARHNRSHSGIKPYFCEVCEKRFSRSDHLSKHMKIHKRDKLITSQEKRHLKVKLQNRC